MGLLIISGSPHVHCNHSTKTIMWQVNIALVPMLLVAIAFFGVNALLISLISVGCCCLFQWLIERFLLHVPSTVSDGSAVVTGLLLSFNVPATADMLWIIAIGALVAIGIAKMAFGGIGKNPFNPALVGRVFLLISFPTQMTNWPIPGKAPLSLNVDAITGATSVDAVTGATPLALVQECVKNHQPISSISDSLPSVWQMIYGCMGGSLGEVSAIAILIGAAFLLIRRIISWHIPVAFIASAFVFEGILYLVDPTSFVDPLRCIFMGGIMLGAFFMATDMTTSPMTNKGRLIFGAGCGLLTIIIRTWGAYPEGVSFAILLMNAVTPLINKWCHPRRFAA